MLDWLETNRQGLTVLIQALAATAAIAIPVVLHLSSRRLEETLKSREVEAEYTRMAVDILGRGKDAPQALRDWSVEVLEAISTVAPLSEEAKRELRIGEWVANIPMQHPAPDLEYTAVERIKAVARETEGFTRIAERFPIWDFEASIDYNTVYITMFDMENGTWRGYAERQVDWNRIFEEPSYLLTFVEGLFEQMLRDHPLPE